MRRFLIPIAALGLVTACEDVTGAASPAPSPSTEAPSPSAVAGASIPPRSDALTYFCANGQVVQARYPDTDDEREGFDRLAELYIDGTPVRMIEGTSTIGRRFIGAGLEWSTRGLSTATLAPLGPGESTASNPGTACRAGG